MIKYISHLALLLFCTVPVIAAEMSQSCHEIIDSDERLACYDKIDKTSQLPLTGTVLDDRIQQEEPSNKSSFSLTAHRPTYILPLTYMSHLNQAPSSPSQPPPSVEGDLDNFEIKFQISFKVLMDEDFIFKNSNLWFGYTQLSLWQLYNSDASAPFRETNYEPELIWSFLINKSFGKLKLTHLAPALNHQSNGRSDPLSRSWNRITLDSIWVYESWVFSLRPWYRLPESDEDDDNADIEDYLGNFDFRMGYKNRHHQFSSLFRNTFVDSEPRSYYELGYSYAINSKFRGYVQFVSGYGESLIDYNFRNKRLSIGIMLNDWF